MLFLLPNITGTLNSYENMIKGSSGAISLSNFRNQPMSHKSDYIDNTPNTITFSAKTSNSIYNTTTVQPKSLTTIYIIKS